MIHKFSSKILFNVLVSGVIASVPAVASAESTATSTDDCASFSAPAAVDAAAWLRQIDKQDDLEKIFACSSAPDALPTGRGKGWGSVRALSEPLDQAQTAVGGLLWGGKVFSTESGQTTLTNLMVDSSTERYNAVVYESPSIFDNRPAVVLDYRVDVSADKSRPLTPAQVLIDTIIHGVRDEIREVRQVDASGTHGTGVFIGRAYLYKDVIALARNASIADDQFRKASEFFLAANFFLDFRP